MADFIKKMLGKESSIIYVGRKGLLDSNKVQEENYYKTISEAVKFAEQGCTIKIAEGVYRENIIINKQVKLQANTRNSNVVIMNQSYPSIIIDLQTQKRVALSFIKLAHSCIPDVNSINQQYVDMQPMQKIKEYTDDYYRMIISQKINCLCYVKSGKLVLEECMLSLKLDRVISFVHAGFKGVGHQVVVSQQACAMLLRCNLRGSPNKNTVGLLSRRGSKIIVKQTIFQNFNVAGIIADGQHGKSQMSVINCKLKNCNTGICLLDSFKPIISITKIFNSKSVGIKIGLCNGARIQSCQIKQNNIGIQVSSADPQIYSNRIYKNQKDGIHIKTRNNFICNGVVKDNLLISQNKQCGIRILGYYNRAIVSHNQFIGFNRIAGVLVQNGAHPNIFKNIISKNIGEGILVVEKSSANIQKNTISQNIKANVAFGGQLSANTTLIKNQIFKGRCEGIFLLESERAMILQNQIYQNNDGIISVTSVAKIQGNKIRNNRANGNQLQLGILAVKDTRSQICHNEIKQNMTAGLFIRDRSHCNVHQNQLGQNKIVDLLIQKKHQSHQNILDQNIIQGEVRIPQNYSCILI